MNRIDIHIEVPAVPPEEIAGRPEGEPSTRIRARVSAARERQLARQGKPNAQLTSREVGLHAAPDAQGEQLLKQAISRLGLSARGYYRILKLARSVADLAGEARVLSSHVAEAIQDRRLDRT